MWPFKQKATLRDLEERLERLERRFLALVEEWDDAFDRIRRAENRISKKRATIPEEQTTETAPEPVVPDGQVRSLSPSQARLQQMILRTRRMQ